MRHVVPLIMKAKYPFYLLAQLLNAKIYSHEKGVLDSMQFYADLHDISELLETWHEEQEAE